jgi:hypothetical protein
MIPHDEALGRVAPQLYGRAATRLGGDAARDVSRRIDASIKRAAGLTLDIPVPDIFEFPRNSSSALGLGLRRKGQQSSALPRPSR